MSNKNDCHQNIKTNWYFTQVKIYFSERNSINNTQITNCATFELWSHIIGSKSERHISSSEESHTISDA